MFGNSLLIQPQHPDQFVPTTVSYSIQITLAYAHFYSVCHILSKASSLGLYISYILYSAVLNRRDDLLTFHPITYSLDVRYVPRTCQIYMSM